MYYVGMFGGGCGSTWVTLNMNESSKEFIMTINDHWMGSDEFYFYATGTYKNDGNNYYMFTCNKAKRCNIDIDIHGLVTFSLITLNKVQNLYSENKIMDLLMNSNCGVFNVDRGSSNSGKYNAIILLDCLPFNEYIIKSDPFLSKVTVIDRMMLLVADKAYHDDIVNLSKDNSKLSDVQEEVEQLKKLFNEN